MGDYTVILLRPDHVDSTPTFWSDWVGAENPEGAIAAARAHAADADKVEDPSDYYVVAVYEGFLNNLNPE